MKIKLDNYYIVVDKGVLHININGHNISGVRYTDDTPSRLNILIIATKLIEDYNKMHGLKWGETPSKKNLEKYQ